MASGLKRIFRLIFWFVLHQGKMNRKRKCEAFVRPNRCCLHHTEITNFYSGEKISENYYYPQAGINFLGKITLKF
jgi:hypothetical protein